MSASKASSFFPFRYLGAKDSSIFGRIFNRKNETPGYHRNAKLLTPEKAIKFKSLVAMTEASFSSNPEKLKEFSSLELIKPEITDLPKDVEVKERCLLDIKTGLKVTLIKDGKTTFVAFGCIYSANPELPATEQKAVVKRQYWAAIKNVLGLEARLFKQAEKVFLKIREQYGNDLQLVGGCLGGAIASYVGLRQNVPTITINGFPIGAGLQRKIGREKLENADKHVKHLIVKGDQFADNRILNIIDRILNFFGIRTPGNFGKKYTIPSMFDSAKKTHELVMKSLLNYCQS